ncbi:MAG: FtsX-like permease family protein [Bacteroidota bacterium]|jgi:ABC-type lipoprotein release transport system permease subunit
MFTLKLALRNILGAGIRTWLNVVALSLSYVVIIFVQGIYNGLNDQVERATIDALYGGGQFWERAYDPYDPLSLSDAHAPIPAELRTLVKSDEATPILICQASIYPEGRFRAILLKGIDPDQRILSIPSYLLKGDQGSIPALIGNRMAKSTGLHKDDELTVQWRDLHGTFDARDVRIVEVLNTSVQEIDNNQIWIPLERLQTVTAMPGQATMVVLKKNRQPLGKVTGWEFKDLGYLLQDIHTLVRSKTVQGSVLYAILLFLALLAIFDTQILSIFRRRKEIGTLMALGMTRTKIIELFTVEGALHGVLAALLAAVYGIPLLTYVARTGFALPEVYGSFGYAIGEKLFPTYSAGLIVGTSLLVLVVTTIVSFFPTRNIAHLKPTDALRGKTT